LHNNYLHQCLHDKAAQAAQCWTLQQFGSALYYCCVLFIIICTQDIIKESPGGEVRPELFHALFPFDLDDFQLEALAALAQRKNVIVSAPTGSGKTVAGELAVSIVTSK
jgi:DEAD/DEAH box helicase